MSTRMRLPLAAPVIVMTLALMYGCASTQSSEHRSSSRAGEDTERVTTKPALKGENAAAIPDWEEACRADTFDDYIRFHKLHPYARAEELRDRLLKCAGGFQPVYSGDLTEHTSYLKQANTVEFHNLDVRYANLSRMRARGGFPFDYPEGGTITALGPLASMSFKSEVTYVFLPEMDGTMVFGADSQGLHYVSGKGTVLAVGAVAAVYVYR